MATDADIEASVLAQLASTDYACSSITRLNGGTANFVYRGVLSNPEGFIGNNTSSREEETDTTDEKKNVIIKHTKDFVALSRDFKLDVQRCAFEASILKALNTFSSVQYAPAPPSSSSSPAITVRTPKIYQFLPTASTQIMEDLPESTDLKTWLLSPETRINKPAAKAIGHALGSWLSSFHAWGSLEQQAPLQKTLAQNESMQRLKYAVNYETLISTIDKYPQILQESRPVFEKVRAQAAQEISPDHQHNQSDSNNNWGLIHGDFWTGNVLVTQQHTLFIIDWELSQLGTRALDLGQMLAELYEAKHFKGKDAGIWIIEGLIEGYAPLLNEEIAFRAAVHMGVHLVCWSSVPGWGEQSQIDDVVRIGRDFVVKGWERDRAWFERDEVMRSLFR